MSKGKALLDLAGKAGFESSDDFIRQLKKQERLRKWAYSTVAAGGGAGTVSLLDMFIDDPELHNLMAETISNATGVVSAGAGQRKPDLAQAAVNHLNAESDLRLAFDDIRTAAASVGGIDRLETILRVAKFPPQVFAAYRANR